MAIDTKGLNPTKTTLTITDYAGEVMVVALPLVGGDDDPCIEHVHGQSAAFASGRSTSVGSFSFNVAGEPVDGDGGLSLRFRTDETVAGYSMWSTSITQSAAPPTFDMVTRNPRVPRTYAVFADGRYIASRRRLGNARRLAAHVGGYVQPRGGGIKWSQAIRVLGVEDKCGGVTTVTMLAVGAPRWMVG